MFNLAKTTIVFIMFLLLFLPKMTEIIVAGRVSIVTLVNNLHVEALYVQKTKSSQTSRIDPSYFQQPLIFKFEFQERPLHVPFFF